VHSDARTFEKTPNESLEFGFSNQEPFRFNILQKQLSRPADWFSVSLNHRFMYNIGVAAMRRTDY